MSELPVGQIAEELEISESIVVDDKGVELLLLYIPGYEGVMQGVAIETSAINSGKVTRQQLYDMLAQEWLNINHGMIPQKKNVILPGDC